MGDNERRNGGHTLSSNEEAEYDVNSTPLHLQPRCLWKPKTTTTDAHAATKDETMMIVDFNELWSKYAQPCPTPKSLLFYVARTLVVVQEVALSLNFLLRYQLSVLLQEKGHLPYTIAQQNDIASFVMLVALLFVVLLNSVSWSLSSALVNTNNLYSKRRRRSLTNKARHRLTDACLIGILLRFLGSLLQSLTASYAVDAVQTLALFGMVLHILTCDYSYSNGEDTRTTTNIQHYNSESRSGPPVEQPASINYNRSSSSRPAFEGGTFSLNAAFFATILLISRLQDSITAYVFCLFAVISFGFYPLTRHELAVAHPPTTSRKFRATSYLCFMNTTCSLLIVNAMLIWTCCFLRETAVLAVITLLLCTSTGILCQCNDPYGDQQLLHYFCGLVFMLLLVFPVWKYRLQFYKVHLRGPWDIPSTESIVLRNERKSD